MKRFICAAALVLGVWSASASAALPQQILGPGLNSGRTDYFQGYDRVLSADTCYVLTGLYYVDSLFSLTIPAGTVIKGDTAATLIVRRGGKVFADGVPWNPIVFTSNKAPGNRNPGDWGGVVLLGRAPVNKVEPLIEGGLIFGSFGGNDPNDSSGRLTYVRIEYPGYRFQLDNEINGLTMGGVGAATELHHIQVSYSFDDSYEWFGGTVSATHLIAYGGTDDGFDSDFGFRGTLQFLFDICDEFYSDPTGETRGMESDNDGSATSTATPYTRPVISNATIVGPERTNALVPFPLGQSFDYSAVIRRSSQLSFYNSVIMGWPWGLSLRDANTITWAEDDTLQWRNVSIQASIQKQAGGSVHDEGRWANVTTWFNTGGYNNLGSAPRMPDVLLMEDLSDLNDPRPIPQAGSELLASADFTNPRLSGLEVTTYRGAFDPTLPMWAQWTASFSNFDPQNTDYDDGSNSPTGVETLALGTSLGQNYPNPFNPRTTVDYRLASTGHVSVRVYDARGHLVSTLVDGIQSAGSHTADFDASGLASGVYFYRLVAGNVVETRKMVLLK